MKKAAFEQAALLRQQKKISLEEIAESTKINIHYLRAIEEQRFERLPGSPYNVNYIRQYARTFGYDEHELVTTYTRLTAPAADAPAPSRRGLPALLGFGLRRRDSATV